MSLAADHPADPAQPGPERHQHFPCFDGLRAIAALAVLLHHVGFATGWSQTHRFGELLAHGDAGVPIFFVISGFLLYRPFVAAHLDGRPPIGYLRFMRRRIVRIVPVFWVALIVIALVFGFENGAIGGWRGRSSSSASRRPSTGSVLPRDQPGVESGDGDELLPLPAALRMGHREDRVARRRGARWPCGWRSRVSSCST